MKVFKSKVFFSLFLILLCIVSCTETAKIANRNLAYSFAKETQILHPQYQVYHSSANKSQLHFSINTSELLYMKSPGSGNYSAKVSISYLLYASFESKQVLDSTTVFLEDDASREENASLHGFIEFSQSYPNRSVMEITIMDLNRNQSSVSYVEVDKSNQNTYQNFLLSDVNSTQLFGNHFKCNDTVALMYDKNSAQKKLRVRYFKPEVSLPSPPFSIQNMRSTQLRPDSVSYLELNKNYKGVMHFSKEGIYFVQSDTASQEGLTLLVFYDDFPLLTDPLRLIPPIRYVTTKQEFDVLSFSTNKKLSLDKFWLTNAGSVEKAKSVLKVFYNRVQNANTYFTSYTEGWRTDRGLIYIAFGLPSSVYRDSNGETWTYLETQNNRPLQFSFSKVDNIFSDNNFLLNRTENYRNDWFRIIDAWRQGKINHEN